RKSPQARQVPRGEKKAGNSGLSITESRFLSGFSFSNAILATFGASFRGYAFQKISNKPSSPTRP
ncbi:MAG: hypothetical protein LBJ21_08415, partial [Acidobacteriota bacterium]|nr:hypothetical protein [Acidobacteriota bacterium]